MTANQPEPGYRYAEKDGFLYRLPEEATPESLRNTTVWDRVGRRWLPVATDGIAYDVWWFGMPLTVDQVRRIIFDAAYASELITEVIEEGKEEE